MEPPTYSFMTLPKYSCCVSIARSPGTAPGIQHSRVSAQLTLVKTPAVSPPKLALTQQPALPYTTAVLIFSPGWRRVNLLLHNTWWLPYKTLGEHMRNTFPPSPFYFLDISHTVSRPPPDEHLISTPSHKNTNAVPWLLSKESDTIMTQLSPFHNLLTLSQEVITVPSWQVSPDHTRMLIYLIYFVGPF